MEGRFGSDASSAIEVRRGNESDAAALRGLLESLKDEGEMWSRMVRTIMGKEEKWIHNHIKYDRFHDREHTHQFLFFAFDGDKMVGQVNGKVSNTRILKKVTSQIRQHIEDYNRKIRLEEETSSGMGIAVRKDYRQKGVGEMLMGKAIQEAKELGATVLFTIVIPGKEEAPKIPFLEKLGFKEHIRLKKGERLGIHTLATDHIFMTLNLK